ncbi:MAG TPA: toll/interleukin-1 receptor domain-containing protein, partial [Thermoanaerobaculia bacterium]|nr:toll/interleukin-1 receptor domain-containing protein [Thermoanaerobaculia bacterium]
MSPAPPRAFISYSHDSAEHDERVRALADRLCGDGVDCALDQYDPHPREPWPRWMDRQIEEADFVLVVCTETYLRRARGLEPPGAGLGVTFESVLIVQDLYDAGMWNEKFIPVLLEGASPQSIPKPLRGYARYKLDAEYEPLLRHLRNEPRVRKPEVRPGVPLPPVDPPKPSSLYRMTQPSEVLQPTSMSQSYDVFLSHSSPDKPAVEKLARKLRENRIKPFFDKWDLTPGKLWQQGLEEGLRSSKTCIIFVGSGGISAWHLQEMLVALDRATREPSFPVIPVLLPGSKQGDIPSFLSQRTWVEFPSLDDKEALHRLVSGIRGEKPGDWRGGRPTRIYWCMALLPKGWVHRREYDEVLEALCSKDSAQARRSIGITTALRGAGGFGKTALAQQLCFDERVRERFPDGILWATMGEEADSNSRLQQIRDLLRWWNQ